MRTRRICSGRAYVYLPFFTFAPVLTVALCPDGYPPYIRPNPTTSAQSIQQNETLDLKAKQWTYRFTARTGGDFEIAYDTNRMYPGGVAVQVQEAGAEGIRVSDDGAGTVKVQVDQAADGKRVMIVTRPKAGGAAKR